MRLLAAVFLCMYLLIDSKAAIERAQEAMTLWYTSVAPAMFPFFALLPVLTDEDALNIYERLFGRIMKKLLRISGSAAAAALVGLIAGSPAGSMAIARAFRCGAISRRDARVLAALATGSGPAFMVSSVGAGMMKDVFSGIKLLFCAWSASFLTAFIVSRISAEGENARFEGEADLNPPGAVREAVLGILTVAGYMTVFRVFAGGLNENLYAFFEISGGCFSAAQKGSFVMASAVAGFGGLCLLAQNSRNLAQTGVRVWELLLIKASTGALSAAFGALLSKTAFECIPFRSDAYRLACVLALIMAFACVFNRLLSKKVS